MLSTTGAVNLVHGACDLRVLESHRPGAILVDADVVATGQGWDPSLRESTAHLAGQRSCEVLCQGGHVDRAHALEGLTGHADGWRMSWRLWVWWVKRAFWFSTSPNFVHRSSLCGQRILIYVFPQLHIAVSKAKTVLQLQYNPPISTADLSTFSYIDIFSNSGIFPSTSLLNNLAYIDLFFSVHSALSTCFLEKPTNERSTQLVRTTP